MVGNALDPVPAVQPSRNLNASARPEDPLDIMAELKTAEKDMSESVLAEKKRRHAQLVRIGFLCMEGKWECPVRVGHFVPREPTTPDADFEYLIHEIHIPTEEEAQKGEGTTYPTYVVRYDESTLVQDVWTTMEDKSTVKRLIASLDFSVSHLKAGPDECCGLRITHVESKPECWYRYFFKNDELDYFTIEAIDMPDRIFYRLEESEVEHGVPTVVQEEIKTPAGIAPGVVTVAEVN